MKALVLDPEGHYSCSFDHFLYISCFTELDVEELPKLSEIENSLAIFCVATYGEGDPTDNAQQLYDYLKDTEDSFEGLSYAVNKNYFDFTLVYVRFILGIWSW